MEDLHYLVTSWADNREGYFHVWKEIHLASRHEQLVVVVLFTQLFVCYWTLVHNKPICLLHSAVVRQEDRQTDSVDNNWCTATVLRVTSTLFQ